MQQNVAPNHAKKNTGPCEHHSKCVTDCLPLAYANAEPARGVPPSAYQARRPRRRKTGDKGAFGKVAGDEGEHGKGRLRWKPKAEVSRSATSDTGSGSSNRYAHGILATYRRPE